MSKERVRRHFDTEAEVMVGDNSDIWPWSTYLEHERVQGLTQSSLQRKCLHVSRCPLRQKECHRVMRRRNRQRATSAASEHTDTQLTTVAIVPSRCTMHNPTNRASLTHPPPWRGARGGGTLTYRFPSLSETQDRVTHPPPHPFGPHRSREREESGEDD
jgi:hypothetical protein